MEDIPEAVKVRVRRHIRNERRGKNDKCDVLVLLGNKWKKVGEYETYDKALEALEVELKKLGLMKGL